MPVRCRLLPLSIITLCGCVGFRTPIDECPVEGQTQPCSNTCGNGTQMCSGGIWSKCQIPPTTKDCSNTCGNGTQTCTDGKWSICQVPPVDLPCGDTCGKGTQRCEDNAIKGVCQVAPVVTDCATVCGHGTQTCANNKQGACNAPQPKQPRLSALIRDFHNSFPDMDHDGISETGIVESTLGADDKPVYAHTGSTATVQSPDTFNKWFRDADGINISTTLNIPLSPSNSSNGVYGYSNNSFFPIDGQLFGNEGLDHNYSFTAEIATSFFYSGGETFTFSGDDDVFVFINRILAIDLGGIHSSLSETVDLDTQARKLGISKGNVYSMHIFFAERHPIGSDFVVETTISQFDVCE